MSPSPTIEPLGDSALLLRWAATIDARVNRRVHAFAAALRARQPTWLLDLTPGYASLAVHVDVTRLAGEEPLAIASACLRERLRDAPDAAAPWMVRQVEIPVCYGGEHGPDLAAVATTAGLPMAEVVAHHTAADYTVAMLGFAPGFAYLLGLDPRLSTPRHARPRAQVAAGSVGIGGIQTGIYPTPSPGGWQIIGRTPEHLFDAGRDPPCLLQPGDHVRFVAIDAATFAGLDGVER